jgi:hypothetical protein
MSPRPPPSPPPPPKVIDVDYANEAYKRMEKGDVKVGRGGPGTTRGRGGTARRLGVTWLARASVSAQTGLSPAPTATPTTNPNPPQFRFVIDINKSMIA